MSNADKDELKPCPFKHSVNQGSMADDYEPYATDGLSEDVDDWCVHCPVCKATSGFYYTEAEAIAAWQSRA
jgi:hypothetical protein